MPHALRQSLPANADDWLSIDAVAERTGEPLRTWAWRARSEFNRAAVEGRTALAVKATVDGRNRWMVNRSIDPRLSAERSTRDVREVGKLMQEHPQHFVDRGLERNRWLQRWLDACAKREDGLNKRQLARRVVDEAKREDPNARISVSSLYGWSQSRERDGIAGLVDKYGGPDERVTRSTEAIDYFYSLYRTENKLSAEECHRFTLSEAQRRDWRWPETAAATRTWMSRYDDLAFSYLMRFGKTAYQHRYMEHLTMNWGAIAPGHMYVADHKQCDFFVQWRGGTVRPWLTAVMDCRSRMIVGTHLGPAPHTEAILQAFHAAFQDYGLPAKMKIDNGKDFTCQAITGATKKEVRRLQRIYGRKWKAILDRNEHLLESDKRWVGVLKALNVEVKLARPYEPWSKPIERWFGTFGEQCAKHFATWCGDKPQNKPEALKELRKGKLAKDANGLTFHDLSRVPKMDEARDSIRAYIDERYHVQPHSGRDMGGRCPLDVWRTVPHTIRRAENEALALLIGVRGAFKVGANGVRVTVGGATITYGRRCQPLWRYKGRKVLVAVDPIKPQFAYAIDADTKRFIAKLDPDQAIHPDANTDDVREAVGDVKRDQAVMHKAQSSSPRRTRTMVQLINEQKRALETRQLATGTDAVSGPITVHRTRFEEASRQIRSTVESIVHDPYAHIKMDDLFIDEPDDAEPDPDDIYANLVIDHCADAFDDDEPDPGGVFPNRVIDHCADAFEVDEPGDETDGEA